MKKKVIGVLLATAMAFGLAACGNSAGGEAVKQETEKAEEAKSETKEEKSGEVTTVTLWSFKAEDNRTPEENELIKLRKENQRLKKENDILKQAALIMGRK